MITGFVESIRPFQVRGWARDTDQSQLKVEVELYDGDLCLGASKADLTRKDLADAGEGDGNCGFVINVSRKLSEGEDQSIHVRARMGSGGATLLPRIAGVKLEELPMEFVQKVADGVLKGFVEVVTSGFVEGWVFDPREPEANIRVEATLDGSLLGASVANITRADLIRASVGKGDHAFRIVLSESLPADILHRIVVQAKGNTGVETLQRDKAREREADVRALGFPGASQDSSQHPVFVLGAARSGTSAILQAIVKSTRYVGTEEGHLLDLIAPLQRTLDSFYSARAGERGERKSTLIRIVPSSFFEEGIEHMFVALAKALFPAGWWIDKTPRPEIIACAPLFRKIWPQSRFIFMKRRGLENIASRSRKFVGFSFEHQCKDWVACMQVWRGLRDELKDSALEVDQFVLMQSPERVGAELAAFLKLDVNEERSLTLALTTDQPERTSANPYERLNIEEMGWSTEQREIFLRVCGAEMRHYGYDIGSAYFAAGQEHQGTRHI